MGMMRIPRGVSIVMVPLVLAGCGDILDVQNPDIVTPETLNRPAGLSTLYAGALGDFALALGGSAAGHGATPGLVHFTTSFTDEVRYAGTFPTRRELDERRVQERNSEMAGMFRNLHRARAALVNAAVKLEEFGENPSADPRLAETRNLVGFSYLFFGENYCSGVPISTAQEDGELVFGEPLTTTELFDGARTWFDQALASTGGSATQENLARVGTGRALLNLGRFGDAAAAVAAVPTSFIFEIEYSDNSLRQRNGFHHLSSIDRQFSIADAEAGSGIPFRSADDPRLPWARTAGQAGQDGSTPFFLQLKYPDPGAPIALATGVEARLIEAEAALQQNNPALFLQRLNEPRIAIGMEPIADPGSRVAHEDLLFRERAFWMWGTAHRLGDLRRLIRQYDREAEAVFPSGPYFKGGTYGDAVNFPIPIDEQNNPNFQGCLNRDA